MDKNKIEIEISQIAYESLIQLAQINKTTQSDIIERAIKTFGNPYRVFLTALNDGHDYVLDAMEVEKELQDEAEKHWMNNLPLHNL